MRPKIPPITQPTIRPVLSSTVGVLAEPDTTHEEDDEEEEVVGGVAAVPPAAVFPHAALFTACADTTGGFMALCILTALGAAIAEDVAIGAIGATPPVTGTASTPKRDNSVK